MIRLKRAYDEPSPNQTVDLLRDQARRRSVTLVYAARDEQHNGALALKEFLEHRKR